MREVAYLSELIIVVIPVRVSANLLQAATSSARAVAATGMTTRRKEFPVTQGFDEQVRHGVVQVACVHSQADSESHKKTQ